MASRRGSTGSRLRCCGGAIFEAACPTFKTRHMFMAGLPGDEEAFDWLAAGYDLRPLVAQLEVPWLVVGG